VPACWHASLLQPVTSPQDEAPEVPAPIAEFIDGLPGYADAEAIQTALLDAGENWVELAEAFERLAAPASGFTEADYANMVWLVDNAPHLDRLELTAEILIDNLVLANAAADGQGYERESEFFRRYILNYRLDEEPVTDWRGELLARYLPEEEHRATRELAIASVVLHVAKGFSEYDRGYYGNLADPVSVDNARAGTGREFALLTAAVLRAQGFGTRFVRENRTGMSWVEVYNGDPREYDAAAWLPVYPGAPERSGDPAYVAENCDGRVTVVTAGDAFGREQVTARYSTVCGFIPRFTRNAAADPDFEHWSVTAWADGYFEPLDDLGYPLGELDYPTGLAEDETVYYLGAPGDYRFQCGTRYPGAVVHVQTRDFTAEPGGLVELEINLDAPADLPLTALIERRADWTEPGEDETPLPMGTYLYLIVDDSEPAVRARDLLTRYMAVQTIDFTELRYDTGDDVDAAFIREQLKVRDDDALPVVVLVVDGETKLYRRGFDLNIGDWVGRALSGE
jgi:hypothetical protein